MFPNHPDSRLEQIHAVDLLVLSEREQEPGLCFRSTRLFSLLMNVIWDVPIEILLLDDIPVWQGHRIFPPFEYEVVRDAFPLTRIEESLDALTGARWFSTMDLASGYNQVPVTEGDKPKSFCTPFGLFEWKQMSLGICNDSSTFQQLIKRLFGDQQCQALLLYLDHIVVFSTSVVQHLGRLEVVLSHFEREGLKVKLKVKCYFVPGGSNS